MKPCPTKLLNLLALFAVLTLPLAPLSANTNLQGEIQFAAERADAVWLGQKLELHLDLWSDGFSFGDQWFVLPEVKGAYLMQADSSTVKLSERRKGVQWQGLRYTFLLYPQKAGRLEVPSFGVRFSVKAGFGSQPAAFGFQTPTVFIEARLPPGADASGLVVTTTSFTVESSWKPAAPDDGPSNLKVGDAVTLEITRRAQDVPGMVFAPLPDFSIDGLRSYPDLAQVNDRVNRGALTGIRTDSVTFICEREGSFEIPQLRFQWWDPGQEVLSEKFIPALELAVAPNPAYASGKSGFSGNPVSWLGWKSVAAIVAAALLLVVTGRWLVRAMVTWQGQLSKERKEGESWAFRQVQKACASGTAIEAYHALTVWLSRIETGRPGLTLMQLAAQSGNTELLGQVTALQRVVAAGSTDEWNGGKLARLLVKSRNDTVRPAKGRNVLHPLNPGALKSG